MPQNFYDKNWFIQKYNLKFNISRVITLGNLGFLGFERRVMSMKTC